MDYLVFAVVAVVAYYMFIRKGKESAERSSRGGQRPQQAPAKAKEIGGSTSSVQGQIDYLKAQWTAAEKERDSGAVSTFPKWFFDPVTERQLERLKNDGTAVSGGSLTKGAASDLISLQEHLDDNDAEILRFFKVPIKGMNQAIGRYEVKRLLSNAENEAAWKARPAEPMQKEYLKFFGLAVPKGLTTVEAYQLMAAHRKEAPEQDEKKTAEWESFESIVNDLDDRETREDYAIKKPSLSAIKEAMAALRAKGEDADDLQFVVDQLIEMKPELARDS